jgi:hypothetical protein
VINTRSKITRRGRRKGKGETKNGLVRIINARKEMVQLSKYDLCPSNKRKGDARWSYTSQAPSHNSP